jgi:hypothetical protein
MEELVQTRVIEATVGQSLWSVFLIGRLDQERKLVSTVDGRHFLRWEDPDSFLLIDLYTKEGAYFGPRGYAKADIQKHAISQTFGGVDFGVTVCTQQHAFPQLGTDLVRRPESNTSPIRVFLRGVFVVKMQGTQTGAVTTPGAAPPILQYGFEPFLLLLFTSNRRLALQAERVAQSSIHVELGGVGLPTSTAPPFLPPLPAARSRNGRQPIGLKPPTNLLGRDPQDCCDFTSGLTLGHQGCQVGLVQRSSVLWTAHMGTLPETSPLFEPFLVWLREQLAAGVTWDDLPAQVELPSEQATESYRHEGPMIDLLKLCLKSPDKDVQAAAQSVWVAKFGSPPPGSPPSLEDFLRWTGDPPMKTD